MNLVENTSLSSWNGSTNLSTTGTITTGTWQGLAIADAYINSASTWNAKQDPLTFTDTALANNVVLMNGIANINDIAIFTTTGIKGLNSNNTKILIGIDNVDNTSDLNKPISTVVQSALSLKQNNLISGILNTNNVVVDSSSVSIGDFAKFTGSGLEGTNIIQLKNDLALTYSDITNLSNWSGSNNITSIGNITNGSWQGSIINESYIDVSIARKSYVDSVAQGLDIKDSVKVTTAENITLSGTQTIDDVAVVIDDRVLVKKQTNSVENGIYLVKSDAWVRANDLNTGLSVSSGIFTFIENGTYIW